jgi:hypothetical protein
VGRLLAGDHLYFGAVHQLKAAERVPLIEYKRGRRARSAEHDLDDRPVSVSGMWCELDGALLDFGPYAQLGPGHDHSEAVPPTLTELWRALPDIDMS